MKSYFASWFKLLSLMNMQSYRNLSFVIRGEKNHTLLFILVWRNSVSEESLIFHTVNREIASPDSLSQCRFSAYIAFYWVTKIYWKQSAKLKFENCVIPSLCFYNKLLTNSYEYRYIYFDYECPYSNVLALSNYHCLRYDLLIA